MSEQRRRMMMTHCFKRIDNLIPDNGMKRKSKASILEATVYYLENIQRSEAHLKRQIAHLHAENVAMSEKIRKCVERDPSVSPIIMERMREIVQKHLNTLNHKAKKDFAPIAPAPQGGAAFIGTIIN